VVVQQLLGHPAIQSSVVPLFAALALGAIFFRSRLSGIGIAGGFLATVYLVGNFAWEPLTATRKLVIVGMGATLLGSIVDLAQRTPRSVHKALPLLFAGASIWVFWNVLAQKPLAGALLAGVATAAFLMGLVTLTDSLNRDPVRAGAAGLGLGLGAGASAVLAASALLGQYGLALGAACGGFLVLVMLFGSRIAGGTTVTLTIAVVGGLIGAAAVLLAELPWWSAAVLALVPVAVRLPLPARAVWLQTSIACAYTLAVAASGCGLAYWATRNQGG
jgi:hypothetical protein